jgi:hypothetical protein
VKQTILHNAEMVRRLHRAIHEAFAHRTDSQEACERWRRACEEFREQYDGLAFPGGLRAALERLAEGDMLTAETAICYLEVHPYFFRSQYNATVLTRRVKKLDLRDDLRERLERVLAAARERKRRAAVGGEAPQREAVGGSAS